LRLHGRLRWHVGNGRPGRLEDRLGTGQARLTVLKEATGAKVRTELVVPPEIIHRSFLGFKVVVANSRMAKQTVLRIAVRREHTLGGDAGLPQMNAALGAGARTEQVGALGAERGGVCRREALIKGEEGEDIGRATCRVSGPKI